RLRISHESNVIRELRGHINTCGVAYIVAAEFGRLNHRMYLDLWLSVLKFPATESRAHGDQRSFVRRGYRLVKRRPMHLDQLARGAISVTTVYFRRFSACVHGADLTRL